MLGINNKVRIILLLLAVSLGLNGCVRSDGQNETEIQKVTLPRTITHACGSIDGITYTNSKEALEYNYSRGCRAFEVDFGLTSDGHLVCIHEWNKSEKDSSVWEHVPTYDEFIHTKIYDKYTTMDANDLIRFMKKHPDMIVVTDTKEVEEALIREEFEGLKKAIEEEDAYDITARFVIQIYHDYMLEVVNSIFPFENYIYTLYQFWRGDPSEFERYCLFCREKGIEYITFSHDRFTDEIMDTAASYGIKVYVHTINDKEEADGLIKRGVYGIYTDELILD